jgi:hypothetical protein
VWRQVTFSAITTSRIRVLVTGGVGGYSRIIEVEAYQSASAGAQLPEAFSKAAPLTGTTEDTNGLTLTWTPSPGATSYEYCLDTTNNNSCDTTWTSTPTLSALVSSLTPNTPYTWQVRARNATGSTDADTGVWWNFTTTASTARVNVALAANGGSASSSSNYPGSYGPNGAINGDRKGLQWGNDGGWNDGTGNTFPDWLEVNFAGPQTITEIDVFTVQDSYASPVTPTLGMPFSLYGLTDFQLQYWDGTQWLVVPGGTISGNNQVWRQIQFPALTTTRIRVLATNGSGGYSRLTEVEAYSATGAP